jgi:membrane-associated PAP2 superfamily phosphatase
MKMKKINFIDISLIIFYILFLLIIFIDSITFLNNPLIYKSAHQITIQSENWILEYLIFNYFKLFLIIFINIYLLLVKYYTKNIYFKKVSIIVSIINILFLLFRLIQFLKTSI